MKIWNEQVSLEWLLCEVVAALLRLAMGIAGASAVILSLLWLGVPSPIDIDWSSANLRIIGVLLLLVGVAGILAPILRRRTRETHAGILYSTLFLGVTAAFLCVIFISPDDRPWLGELGDLVGWFAWVSIAGGLCLIWTALVPMRHQRVVTERDPALGW